jgi:tRNA modification GTPase
MSLFEDTIVALATAPGVGAIGVIRVSGPKTYAIVNEVFKGKDLFTAKTHTVHLGTIRDGEKIIDEVLVTLFKGPNSYTKEDVIEISCHGSPFIIQQLIKLLLTKGARLAKAGEFTQRAFLHGRFDLAQAEAVADLIASENESMHTTAMRQMRGGFSDEIKKLRHELVHFASMIELELDFGEEDVEFANRDDLKKLIYAIKHIIARLTESFKLGNAIKNGIPTVIAGKPNAGKSTLLNALLNEEKAIVSDIPGTTRDVIEDVMNVEGIAFRFTDTAGIRTAEDKVEAIGVERTMAKMKDAAVILYLIDLANDTTTEIETQLKFLEDQTVPYLVIGNKSDSAIPENLNALPKDSIIISASQKENLENLKTSLKVLVSIEDFKSSNTIITNLRHYESLTKTDEALDLVLAGIENQVTNDFVAMDIRQSLHHLGEITGEITTDDLLANIFGKFCIGK